jgi:endo-1,3(4)-beta-glucanase
MGQPKSSSQKPLKSSIDKKSWRKSWRETWKETLASLGLTTTSPPASASAAIPEDNIFVPIAQDNILPQIPIGRHHPVPRTGIEDEDRPLHTNKFYANAFLGGQDHPVWTQPYSIWWGKGNCNGQFPTWGMIVGHVEEGDLNIADGDPAPVSKSRKSARGS